MVFVMTVTIHLKESSMVGIVARLMIIFYGIHTVQYVNVVSLQQQQQQLLQLFDFDFAY